MNFSIALHPGDFDGEALGLHVHDLGPEQLGHLGDLRQLSRPVLTPRSTSSVNEVAPPVVDHLHHVDQLVELPTICSTVASSRG